MCNCEWAHGFDCEWGGCRCHCCNCYRFWCPPRCLCCFPKTRREIKRLGFRSTVLFFVGSIFLLIGILVPMQLTTTLNDAIADLVTLDSTGAQGWKAWKSNHDSPTPIEMYLMDVKNPLEILRGEKPVVDEIGPFVYRLRSDAFNWTFNEDHTELSYRKWDRYIFDLDASIGPDTGYNIRTFNMPFLSTATVLSKMGLKQYFDPLFGRNGLNLDEEHMMFDIKTPREILFGYFSNIFAAAASAGVDIDPQYPGLIPNKTFSKFLNDTNFSRIYTGRGQLKMARQMILFEGDAEPMCCPSLQCPPLQDEPLWEDNAGAVGGSDGVQYPPGVSKGQSLDLFWVPFFRKVSLKYVGQTKFRDIHLLRYTFPDTTYLSRSTYEPNGVFYQNGVDGFVNLSRTLGDVPLFLSQPHFHGADPSAADAVIGAWPPWNEATMGSVFDVEPRTGLTFHSNVAVQFVTRVKPIPDVPFSNASGTFTTTWFKDAKETLVPVFYSRAEDGIKSKDAKEFRKVYTTEFVTDFSEVFGLFNGSLILLIAVVGIIRSCILNRRLRLHKIKQLIIAEAIEHERSSVLGEPSRNWTILGQDLDLDVGELLEADPVLDDDVKISQDDFKHRYGRGRHGSYDPPSTHSASVSHRRHRPKRDRARSQQNTNTRARAGSDESLARFRTAILRAETAQNGTYGATEDIKTGAHRTVSVSETESSDGTVGSPVVPAATAGESLSEVGGTDMALDSL